MKLFNQLVLLLFTNIIGAAPLATITLKVGEKKRIELPGNRTTGFSWIPTKQVNNLPNVKLLSTGYLPNKTNLPGSGGVFYWDFMGKAPGTSIITFEYKRLWEKDVKPADTKKFVISVE